MAGELRMDRMGSTAVEKPPMLQHLGSAEPVLAPGKEQQTDRTQHLVQVMGSHPFAVALVQEMGQAVLQIAVPGVDSAEVPESTLAVDCHKAAGCSCSGENPSLSPLPVHFVVVVAEEEDTKPVAFQAAFPCQKTNHKLEVELAEVGKDFASSQPQETPVDIVERWVPGTPVGKATVLQ